MSEQNRISLSKEKFSFVNKDRVLHDEKLQTKPIGYFKDAWMRFTRNKSALVAFVLIIILVLFAIFVPIFSIFTVEFRDPYYHTILPKSHIFAGTGFWDGTSRTKINETRYLYLKSIGEETGRTVVVSRGSYVNEDVKKTTMYDVTIDTYLSVGYAYVNMRPSEFEALVKYQNETGIQVLYPLPRTMNTSYLNGNDGANFWYKLADETASSKGDPVLDENGGFIPNYILSDNPNYAGYDSLRIKGDDGGENGDSWYIYARKNQSGLRVRVDYYEYFRYQHGQEPFFLFGTNVYGQDMLTCLAAGARLSFLLAISVSLINFVIGACYGAIEGYYGGTVDIVMERISDILYDVPFMVVATLFQLHLAKTVGVLGSLLFAFVLTGWVGMAARVRTQFYRFKGHEYVLAARTLGASDRRLIFKHIFPNSLGTIITGSVLAIPGVIFSESMLSYLHIIDLETSSMTSIGTLLAGGQSLLSTYPHVIFFPALFISILEISFNLFGNGLRDAFNPSLRGAED